MNSRVGENLGAMKKQRPMDPLHCRHSPFTLQAPKVLRFRSSKISQLPRKLSLSHGRWLGEAWTEIGLPLGLGTSDLGDYGCRV